MKKLLILFVAAFSTLSSTAQNYYEEPTLIQIEIYATQFDASYYAGLDRRGVLNYGTYIKISDKEVINEYKIEECVGQLEKYKGLEPCNIQYETRAILILTYEGVPKKGIYYIEAHDHGVIHNNTVYRPQLNLYKTIYSFMPKQFFDEEDFTEELSSIYDPYDED